MFKPIQSLKDFFNKKKIVPSLKGGWITSKCTMQNKWKNESSTSF